VDERVLQAKKKGGKGRGERGEEESDTTGLTNGMESGNKKNEDEKGKHK